MKIPFDNIADIKEYVPRLGLTKWESIVEFVRHAAVTYIIPAIGQDLYDELCGKSDASSFRRSLAYYAAFGCVQAGGILTTGQGNQRMESDTLKTANYADKMDALNYYAQGGDNALDALLSEIRAEDPRAVPSDTDLFVRSPSDLARYAVSIAGSQKTFASLRPFLLNAGRLRIVPVIGRNLFDALYKIDTGQDADLSGFPAFKDMDEKARKDLAGRMIDAIKGAQSNCGMAGALPLLTLRLTEGAVTVASFYSPSPSDRQALIDTLATMSATMEGQGAAYLNTLVTLNKEPGKSAFPSNDKGNKHYSAIIIST